MKLTVFGHWGGYPKANDGTSSYLLEEDGFKLLVDIGASAVSIMQNYLDPDTIDAAIISHYHPDHVADLGILQHVRLLSPNQEKPPVLPVYGHKEDDRGFSYLEMEGVTKAHEYRENEVLTVGPFTISFLKTIHPVPCYAMRIEANGKVLVYTADSAYQESFIPFAKEADLLITDTNFFKEMAGKSKVHMASVEVGKLAQQANVKSLLLSHLPQVGDLEKLKQEASEVYSGPVEIATKGFTKNI
ncbi:MBL fold metallo-hydrolase [Listeria aquatica]|uniref:Beta-lactamase superfamily protein n=1 Tax=Listeria aquatica FSL S10-1188 TaxID=1265818 RepID=W7BAC6_9LIST|nr:MBL fold metallo-hydrolase [Listeria aquatica]EUJ19841.1 beta-lactamase superfamily protein [Listeria aquatica FSL S10-1188]